MTPEVLRELIAGGETLDVELKGEEGAHGMSGAPEITARGDSKHARGFLPATPRFAGGQFRLRNRVGSASWDQVGRPSNHPSASAWATWP